MFKFAIICGGPSLERGVSLNSARSLLDHCQDNGFEISVIYVDSNCQFYQISPSQLYSNTPADFDFKLKLTGKTIKQEELKDFFKQFNLIFPAIHGKFGESGILQKILEEADVPFVGSNSESCHNLFDKYRAKQILSREGYKVLDAIKINKNSDHEKELQPFLNKYPKVIVKPVSSGSSIGVSVADDYSQAQSSIKNIFDLKIDDEILIEEYCRGREFTILVLDIKGTIVSMVPTEIEISYENNQILDYRKKYLPTHNTLYHTPPTHFSTEVCLKIQDMAVNIFKLFKMRDVARLDGWVTQDGQIMFTDFNPISGMEQNSFLFRQTSLVGLSHAETLRTIIESACRRNNVELPPVTTHNAADKKKLFILFGGKTPERQVSLMSGTNIWLKLLKSNEFQPKPMILDKDNNVWSLPYSYCLNHTVEEIIDNCQNSAAINKRLEPLLEQIYKRCKALKRNEKEQALKYNFSEFVDLVKQNDFKFVFLGLHGGDGENGTIQKIFEEAGILFNGSGSATSAICMDKFETGLAVNAIANQMIYSLNKFAIKLYSLTKDTIYEKLWEEITSKLGSDNLIIKPKSEGCSAGIVKLKSCDDLRHYATFVQSGDFYIPANSFENQSQIIELPENIEQDYIIEEYIIVDQIKVSNGQLDYKPYQGWIELTVGVIEKNKSYHSLNPSITIAEGAVLSLEEKFQGGTGINITPPPEEIISHQQLNIIKEYIALVAQKLAIQNYARIDIFFNNIDNKVIVIEINSLPALTPSTVIFHQALAEPNSIFPEDFLKNLISAKISETNYEKIH